MPAIPFSKVFIDGKPTTARSGDRFIYDQRSGTLQIFRSEGDLQFEIPEKSDLSRHCFVGRHWNADMTAASAELYARLGGLRGDVSRVEGSFPSLITYELIG